MDTIVVSGASKLWGDAEQVGRISAERPLSARCRESSGPRSAGQGGGGLGAVVGGQTAWRRELRKVPQAWGCP